MNGNFHGRTMMAVSLSTDPDTRREFGPYLSGFESIEYGNIEILEKTLRKDSNICAVLMEPIQGEAGVFIPSSGYLKKSYDLCKKYNVLFIADEVQTGLARTGKMLACDHENVKPDILILGKALSGGVLPVSAVLADDEIMMCIKPGEHGSTYGGNPLACRVAMAALEVLKEEHLVENSFKMGNIFRERLKQMPYSWIREVRGKGLLNAVEISEDAPIKAWDLCLKMKNLGLLAKPTHNNIIRFAPPLVINENQINQCCDIIEKAFQE